MYHSGMAHDAGNSFYIVTVVIYCRGGAFHLLLFLLSSNPLSFDRGSRGTEEGCMLYNKSCADIR